MPTPLNITTSGENTANATPAVNYPAHNVGDLVVLHLFIDDDDAITLPGSGPGSETINSIFNGDSGSTAGPALAGCYFIANATRGAGSLSFGVAGGGEEWLGRSFRVAAGDFNSSTPIDSVSAVGGSSTDSNDIVVPSYTASANAEGGAVICAVAADLDPQATTETGWTSLTYQDIGGVSAQLWRRDTDATASASVASVTFDLSGADTDTTSAFGYVINVFDGVLASGSPSITKPTAAGSGFVWPRVYLNTTPDLEGSPTQLTVTDVEPDGSSITFDDPEGSPTGSLYLIVRRADGVIGSIAVTVNAGAITASGSPSITKPTSTGSGVVGRHASGSPSITKPTSSGTGIVGRSASGSPSITKPTSTGTGERIVEASGSASITKPTAAGAAERVITASGSPQVTKPTSTGTATVEGQLVASGSPVITKPTSAGAGERIVTGQGSAQTTPVTSAGTAIRRITASGSATVAKPTSSGAGTNTGNHVASGSPVIAKPTVVAIGSVGRHAQGSAVVSKPVSSGVAEVVRLISGAAEISKPTASGTGFTIGQNDGVLKRVVGLDGVFDQSVELTGTHDDTEKTGIFDITVN